MNTLHTLTTTFDLKILHRDLPLFRGAVAQLAGRDQDLFHNHNNDARSGKSYRQRYPLIQYRVHRGHAGIFGVNEGAVALEEILETQRFSRFSMKGRYRPLELSGYIRDPAFEPVVSLKEEMYRYRIYSYIPFSPRAYQEFKSQFDILDKFKVLQRILRNHVVAFAWGVGWELREDRRIEVTINDLERIRKVTVKGQSIMAFDLDFSVNAKLPEGVGLGRKSAFGFGATIPLKGG